MTYQTLIEQIEQRRQELLALRPIDPVYMQKIQQKFLIGYTYHSNHLEGNHLTYHETWSLLTAQLIRSDSLTRLRDVNEIQGHHRAVTQLGFREKLAHLELGVKDTHFSLTENFIRELNAIILVDNYKKKQIIQVGDIEQEIYLDIIVGQYKKGSNFVRQEDGTIFEYATAQETPMRMGDLIVWLKESMQQEKYHPIELASLFHFKFIRIHPFTDGNGRVCRLLVNMILMHYGYPIIIVPSDKDKKDGYYKALESLDVIFPGINEVMSEEDSALFADFTMYLGILLLESLDWMIKGAKGEEIFTDDDIMKELKMKIQKKIGGELPDVWTQERLQKFHEISIPIIINQCVYIYENIKEYFQVNNENPVLTLYGKIVTYKDYLLLSGGIDNVVAIIPDGTLTSIGILLPAYTNTIKSFNYIAKVKDIYDGKDNSILCNVPLQGFQNEILKKYDILFTIVFEKSIAQIRYGIGDTIYTLEVPASNPDITSQQQEILTSFSEIISKELGL